MNKKMMLVVVLQLKLVKMVVFISHLILITILKAKRLNFIKLLKRT